MSSNSKAEENAKNDLFDQSMASQSDLTRIKKEIFDRTLRDAPQAAKQYTDRGPLSIARELAAIAYREFEQMMKSAYSTPDYEFFLQSTIKKQFPYFHSDLRKLITKILDQNNFTNSEQPSKNVDQKN